MRSILQFIGWGSVTFCAMIIAGAVTQQAATANTTLPPATTCTQCYCSLSNQTCRSQNYSGCSGLCNTCVFYTCSST